MSVAYGAPCVGYVMVAVIGFGPQTEHVSKHAVKPYGISV